MDRNEIIIKASIAAMQGLISRGGSSNSAGTAGRAVGYAEELINSLEEAGILEKEKPKSEPVDPKKYVNLMSNVT